MFETMFYGLPPLRVADLGALSLLLIAALWRWCTVRWDSSMAYKKCDDVKHVPLTFPYFFPILGSLPITYLWKPRDFVLNRKYLEHTVWQWPVHCRD